MTGERSDWIDLGDSFEFPSVSWARRLRCLPGKAAVVMALPRSVASGLALPDEVGARLRPDVGVVASVGSGVELVVGDLVAVDPYAGKWILDESGAIVRMIGDETVRAEEPALVAWSEQVFGKLSSERGETLVTPASSAAADSEEGARAAPVTQSFTPTDRNLVVALMEAHVSDAGILLPDSVKPRGAVWRVAAVGPRVADLSVGDSVILQEGALQWVAFGDQVAAELGVAGSTLAVVHERHVYAVLEA